MELIVIAGGAFLLIFFLPKCIGFLWPFVAAWIVAMLAHPVIAFLEDKISLPKRFGSALIIIGVIAGLIAQQLAPVEASARGDVHAEGRAVVLDEPQLEPVGEDDDRLVEVHMGLDPDFERLVCDEQQHDEQRYFLEIHNRSGIRLQK